MKDELGFLGTRTIFGAGTLAELSGFAGTRAKGRVFLGWAAGDTDTDRDPGSDQRVIERV